MTRQDRFSIAALTAGVRQMFSFRDFADGCRRFYRDEEGANVLESVLLVAIAAIICIAIKATATSWQGEVQKKGNEIVEMGN
jgi:Flp pilus assembly pilin Flp